jgi:glycosyltransferase involved in cell wall biosynthesis
MKILLISYFYSMSDSTGSLRGRAMAKYLPQNGIEVAVLTYRPQNEAVSFSGNIVGVRDITRKTVSLPVFYALRLWQMGLRWFGIYRGLCGYWRDAALKHSDEIIQRVKPDAILVSYPVVEALEIGVVLSKKYELPLISDFRDGLVFEPLETAALKHAVTRRHYKALEERVVEASKLILTVSKPISAYFLKHYMHPNVLTLHNGFDPNDITLDKLIALPTDVINIIHTGRLGSSEKDRGVDSLSTAVHMLLARSPSTDQKFEIHFIGQLSRSEKSCLAPLVKRGVVKLWGNVSRAKALEFQRSADVLLLITAPDKASIATGKLFEYLLANKPILALTRGSEAARIVSETGAGLVIQPDKPNEIAEALENIIRHGGRIKCERKQESIMNFSRDKQMAVLASKLKCI